MGEGVYRKKALYDILIVMSIVIGICLVSFAVKRVWPFGTKTVAWADMTHSMPLYYYWWDVLNGQDSMFFSWRYGAGLSTLGIVSQMGMLSPLNMILALFERSDVYGAVGILLIVKLACMSASMYFYLLKYNISVIYRSGAAIVYAFGMHSLVQNPISMTLDMAILLPIFMWAYWRVLNENKTKSYIVILTVIFCINLYMGMMIAFYVIVSTFAYVYMSGKDVSKESLVSLTIATMYGIAFSAVIWLPVGISYINSSRVSDSSMIRGYIDSISEFELPNQVGLITLNLSSVITIIIWLVCKNKLKFPRSHVTLQFFLMLFAMLIPSVEVLWHLGSHSGWPWRFCFIFEFTIIELASWMLQENKKIEHEQNDIEENRCNRLCNNVVWLIGILLFLLVSCTYNEFQNVEKGVVIGNIILIVINIVILRFVSKGKRVLLGVVFGIGIVTSCMIWIAPNWSDRQDFSETQYIYKASEMEQTVDRESDRWARTKDYDGIMASNYSSVMDVYSVANWIHVVNQEKQNTLKELGYSTAYTRFLDTGGTIFSDLLLGYKYAFSNMDIENESWIKEEKDSSIDLYTIKYSMPNVFEVSDDINSEDVENSFEYQNELFKEITGIKDQKLFEEIVIDDLASIMNVEIKDKSEIYFMATKGNFNLRINDKDVVICNLTDYENRDYPVTYNNGIIDLGTFQDENVKLEIKVLDNDKTVKENIKIATMYNGLIN